MRKDAAREKRGGGDKKVPVSPCGFIVVLCLAVLTLVPGRAGAQTLTPAVWYARGVEAMAGEDWYAAAEAFIECLRLNPAHAEGTAALAECYYALGEFDEALLWTRKARTLARGSASLANLEAFTLTALGRLEEAAAVVAEVLAKEPYNREALFAAAELDIARGRSGDAVTRYREAVKRYPDDRRLLVSLALVLGSLGDNEGARSYIERALIQHPGDYRVSYYAAYLASREGRVEAAVGYAEDALAAKPGYPPALSLLAGLRYRQGRYAEAAALADAILAGSASTDDEKVLASYLKGMAYSRQGRVAEAIAILSGALTAAPEDEFIRFALEDLLVASTSLEDSSRTRWADWHFARGRDFRARSLIDQALFEYRRGLRLNPYAPDRREYADLLRVDGYPARYLEELLFLQSLGQTDRDLEDALESYDALLGDALFRRWEVDPVQVTGPHWKVAVFALAGEAGFLHADAGAVGAAYVKDLLVHERGIEPVDLELRQSSFSSAFRAAREGGADYFMMISVSENDRDLSLTGELYVARTGALAARFTAYRTGQDRLRYAGRNIIDQLTGALPFRAVLVSRQQAQGLIDKGRADGVKAGDVFEVVRQGSVTVLNEGTGVYYAPGEIVGTFTVETADEEVSAGVLARNGFFDRISPGDEIFLAPAPEPEGAATNAGAAAAASAVTTTETTPADPELRSLLRALR